MKLFRLELTPFDQQFESIFTRLDKTSLAVIFENDLKEVLLYDPLGKWVFRDIACTSIQHFIWKFTDDLASYEFLLNRTHLHHSYTQQRTQKLNTSLKIIIFIVS